MSDALAFARGILEAQPFSRLLGARLVSVGPHTAEIALTLDERLRQQHGFAHGGVVSYLADNAITFAGGLALGGDALTSEFKVNYARPAMGDTLIARAEALSVGRTQAVCRCDVVAVKGGEERVCALAQGTVIAVPGSGAGEAGTG